jgi:transposase
MQEGRLLMTQADRDRLVTLKKAKKRLITQREAAEELGVSARQVKRLLHAMKKRGDKAGIHGLRGRPSNRRIPEAKEKEAVKTLSAEVYQDFGPTGEKRKRDEPGVEKDAVEMPPTQIGRALRELGIGWIAAHSPQAKDYASHCTSWGRAATTCDAGSRLEYRTP